MTVLVEVIDQAELFTLRRNHKVVGVVQPEAAQPLLAEPEVQLPQKKVDFASLAGSISKETGERWQREIDEINEWERDF